MERTEASHKPWIGCTRAVAIFLVMLFHGGKELAIPGLAVRMSFCCVVLFFLLGGVTAALSMERNPGLSYPQYLLRRLPPLLLPYLACCCLYAFVKARQFSFPEMLYKVATFSYEVHLYYVFVYLQILLVAPLLMRLVRACGRSRRPVLMHALALLGVTAFAYAAMRWTRLLPLSGNGRYLLGGSYLPCFYFGMLLAYCRLFPQRPRACALTGALALIGWVAVLYFEKFYSGQTPYLLFSCWEFNPPSVELAAKSVLLLYACQGLFTLLASWRVTRPLTTVLDYIGSRSLYIYLYLLLIRALIFNRVPITNLHLLRLVTFASMIALPLLGKKLWDLCFSLLKRVYDAGRPLA